MWFEVLLVVLIVLYIWNKGVDKIHLRHVIQIAIVAVVALLIYRYLKDKI